MGPDATASPSTHWEDLYRRQSATAMSWFRPHLDTSLALMAEAGLGAQTRVIDIGGGASTLVDDLLARGVVDLSVLDLAAAALAVAQARLGAAAASVRWLHADVLRAALPPARYDFWHDRAVLHFLAAPDDLRRYAAQATATVAPGGHALIAGFAPDGPERCSGLPVVRRAPADIAQVLGDGFVQVATRREVHRTPAGGEQAFSYALLRRR